MTMDIQTVKLDLIQWLAGLQDPAKVLKIMEALKQIEMDEFRDELKPMTKEELFARADAADRDIEEGRYIDIDELAKECL